MYSMCVILCLFNALSRRVGSLQISIIIIKGIKVSSAAYASLDDSRSLQTVLHVAHLILLCNCIESRLSI